MAERHTELVSRARGRAERREQRQLVSEHVVNVDIELRFDVDGLSDDALQRIGEILRREGERIAQIAAVDRVDQERAREDAARIAKLPKNRSHVVVNTGGKEPERAVVLQGEVTVGGRKLRAEKR